MDDLIKRARAAMDGVTPEPWAFNTLGEFGPMSQEDDQSFGLICEPSGECFWPNRLSNARFIAAARSLVPEMADRIEALEGALRMIDAAVFNDNGDVTYDASVMAKAHRLARAALGGDT